MGNGAAALTKAFQLAGLLTGVDPQLLSSVCYVESHHNINARVLHDGGSPSYGACQVKLATARALGYVGREGGLMEPSLNSYYAAKYLAQQKRRYGTWTKAVSAFNCGHACGNKKYVRKVLNLYRASVRETRLCGGGA